MKKLLAIVMVLVLVVSMTACGVSAPSFSEALTAFEKAGYEVYENEPDYWTADDLGISPRELVGISSAEVGRELDSGAADWGEIIYIEYESADRAASAFETMMRYIEEDGYDERDIEITERKGVTRAVLDLYDDQVLSIISHMGNCIYGISFDYDDFDDADVIYDYLPLEIADELGI